MTRSAVILRPNRASAEDVLDVHVALLTNFVPPYRVPVLEALQDRVRRLNILVSTPIERNRSWSVETNDLDVQLQRTVSIDRIWRHPSGFSDPLYIHFPWSTPLDLSRLAPDIVISAELGTRSILSAAYCAAARRPLVIWATLSERTEQRRGPLRYLIRRWLLRRADRVIVNGESGARYVRRFGVPDQAVDRIPYTALPWFGNELEPRHSPTALRLLFAGQLTERKGLVPFVHTLDAWCARHSRVAVEFIIAGSGRLGHLLERLRASDNLVLRLVGERDAIELCKLYAQADAFVFPTLADEWGLVVNEALAAGLPVLGSIHSQAVQELCGDGEVGWLFDPDDQGSMEAAIDRALTSSAEERARMRAIGMERVRGLTPDWAADRIVDSLRAALAAPPAGNHLEAPGRGLLGRIP